MFAKSHDIIVLDFSGTQDMSIRWTGTVRLKCFFAKPLAESIVLILPNQFETCWQITPFGSGLSELVLWTQIK